MVQVMKVMVTFFRRSHACTAALSAPDPRLCRRPLDTHRQVWVSLFGGHSSFLLGPGEHKVLFVPSKSLFLQSPVSSGGSMVGLMATSSKRAYAIPRSAAPRTPAPAAGHCWPVPPQDWLSFCGVFGSWCTQGLFEPSKCLWWEWSLILNVTSPILPSCWGFLFALGYGIPFFGGIQHSPVHGCSAASCNFGVLLGEGECTSFYSAIFLHHTHKAVVCRSLQSFLPQ